MPFLPAQALRLYAAGFLVLVATPASAQNAPEIDPVVVDSETESVINGALRYLAARQSSNGSWSLAEGRRGAHPVAMTGYVLLAFMSAGHLPEEGEFARH
nr:hypothetical protein [Verrucomicrobiota bacterium]